MNRFEKEGIGDWSSFGDRKDGGLPSRFPDFITDAEYSDFLRAYNLENKKVIDIGSGYQSVLDQDIRQTSALPEILEGKGADVVAIDVARLALDHQDIAGNQPVLGDAFNLPLKDGSIDGGAVVLNLLNSSFTDKNDKEVYMNPKECKRILGEIYRVLDVGSFLIVSSFGYNILSYPNQADKTIGPKESYVIPLKDLGDLATQVGFKKVRVVYPDRQLVKARERAVFAGLPEIFKGADAVNVREGGALFLEK